MRLLHTLTLAAGLIVAAPTSAQDNNVATENAVTTQAVDVNAVPAPAPEAAPATTTTATDATAPAPASRGLPWGAIGLIGLVGLLGARRAKG
jgi:hypothetical protein